MTDARLRLGEEDDAPLALGWDSVWKGEDAGSLRGSADWAVAAAGGGLEASAPLATAIVLCLFTDRRRPDDMTGIDDSPERRGWHGDVYDIESEAGERPLGSLLWTLSRTALTSDAARMAEHYAADALQTLIDQGLVARFDIRAEVQLEDDRLALAITAHAARGETAYSQIFTLE